MPEILDLGFGLGAVSGLSGAIEDLSILVASVSLMLCEYIDAFLGSVVQQRPRNRCNEIILVTPTVQEILHHPLTLYS